MLHSQFKVWVVVHPYMVKKGWFFCISTYNIWSFNRCFYLFRFSKRQSLIIFCAWGKDWISFSFIFQKSEPFVPTKCKQKIVFCTFRIFLKANKRRQMAYKMQSFIHLLCILKDDFSCPTPPSPGIYYKKRFVYFSFSNNVYLDFISFSTNIWST
jgi:hypothetical protein